MNKRKIAEIIYDATRIEAKWSNRRIIPEEWGKRDLKFKMQFIRIIGKYLSQKRLPTLKQAHNSWMKAYLKMGWRYGRERNQKLKTHPDLIPFERLPKDEKDKDAIFLIIVWSVRKLLNSN